MALDVHSATLRPCSAGEDRRIRSSSSIWSSESRRGRPSRRLSWIAPRWLAPRIGRASCRRSLRGHRIVADGRYGDAIEVREGNNETERRFPLGEVSERIAEVVRVGTLELRHRGHVDRLGKSLIIFVTNCSIELGFAAVQRWAVQPPSTNRLSPVIHSASSEARKATARATSPGSPRRGRLVCSREAWMSSSVR